MRGSLSLAAQLLLAFVSLLVGTTAALTVVAYRSSLRTLEAEAVRDTAAVAQAREQALTQRLTLRRQRAEGFLVSLESICGEPAGPRGFGWSEECVGTMVREFTMTEQAAGSLLLFRGRVLTAAGDRVQESVPPPDAIVDVVRRESGRVDLRLRATRGEATFMVQFAGADILPIFQDRSGLGQSGEVFLADAGGRLLTPARYGGETGVLTGAAVAEPLQHCGAEGETIGLDYRGVRTIHGYRPVPVLGGGCIDAHIAYDEALAPAEALRDELFERSVVFVLAGALISLLAARRIAAPVRRLAASARAIQAGDFHRPVPIGGPAEVRALGTAFEAMARDLGQLVASEQGARRAAEDESKSKDRFLAVVSHELRTPLNAVIGWTRMLSTGTLEPRKARRALDAIERNAGMQQQLIEELLDVSRVVAGRLRIAQDRVDLAAVIEAAADAVRPAVEEKGLRLEVTVDRQPAVRGDAQRLQQVIGNLLSNAVKFTPRGGRVAVRLEPRGPDAVIEVTDTGVGISRAFLPHVFDWFRQADEGPTSGEAGLGLGLGLVRQLVELHGGTVGVHSEGEGRGASFTVTLPAISEQ